MVQIFFVDPIPKVVGDGGVSGTLSKNLANDTFKFRIKRISFVDQLIITDEPVGLEARYSGLETRGWISYR